MILYLELNVTRFVSCYVLLGILYHTLIANELVSYGRCQFIIIFDISTCAGCL